jgi:Na+-driven multidrug efflux pump
MASSNDHQSVDVKFNVEYIRANLPQLFRLAAPIATTYLIQISIQTISLMVIGRIDGKLLGSCALGAMM